jgi:3-oxoacyl-[acyl-carrier-protein] synthase-1
MAGAWLAATTLSCAAGVGLPAVRRAIVDRVTGLRPDGWPAAQLATWLGAVPGLASAEGGAGGRDDWPSEWAALDSRNNRLAWLGFRQDGFADQVRAAVQAFGPDRIGIVVGTSTSSIGRTEEAFASLDGAGQFRPEYRQPGVHAPHSTGEFLARVLQVTGPCLTVSTACSSSAKAVATGDRWLAAGLVDAVIVAGVDSLCRSTVHGFHALQLLAPERCRPFDARRAGLNIGEASAWCLLTRERPSAPVARLLGSGESSDAHHMSSPHPDGLGARLALAAALAEAGLTAGDLGYVNLHGTATRANDSVEAKVLAAALPPGVPCSSTKGWTGHTLGAAGLVEAVLAVDTFATAIMTANQPAQVDTVASNSFGFGGTNCVLVFGRPDR